MVAVSTIGHDPTRVAVSGYTKGSLLVANAAGNLTPLAVGPDTDVVTAKSVASLGVEWDPASGGGGGGTPVDFDAARFGLAALTFPPEVATGSGAPLNAGVFVVEPLFVAAGVPLNRPGIWVVTEGSGGATGINQMGIFDITGHLLAVTSDMTSVLSASGEVYAEGIFTVTVTPNISSPVLLGIVTHFGSRPVVGATGGTPNLPKMLNVSPGGFLTGVTTLADFDPNTLNHNNGGYVMGLR